MFFRHALVQGQLSQKDPALDIRAQVEKFLNVVKKDFPVHSDFPAVNILLIVN
jgi:hypothetical protein